MKRPLVELQKNNEGKYRIVGTYKGEVSLDRDQLTDINLTFWFWKEAWYLINTNLTRERASFAEDTRKKHTGDIFAPDELIIYLEQLFKTQFPKADLHETVTSEDLKGSAKTTDL